MDKFVSSGKRFCQPFLYKKPDFNISLALSQSPEIVEFMSSFTYNLDENKSSWMNEIQHRGFQQNRRNLTPAVQLLAALRPCCRTAVKKILFITGKNKSITIRKIWKVVKQNSIRLAGFVTLQC